MIEKNSIGDMQPLSESFIVQIRKLKTPLLPNFLSSSITKIVVYFPFSNNSTHMADEAHGAWSDLTNFLHFLKQSIN